MARSRGKKDSAYSALDRLMQEPGSDHDILQDLLHNTDTNPQAKIAQLLAGIPQYSDRDCAIVFGSLLERALESAIGRDFMISPNEARRLFSYIDDGPLAKFSSKIAMGYALGIYDARMNGDLKWVARIRNAFAHARVDVTFATQAVVLACDQLLMLLKPKSGESFGIAQTPRQRFTTCVGLMTLYLTAAPPGSIRYQGNSVYEGMYNPRRT